MIPYWFAVSHSPFCLNQHHLGAGMDVPLGDTGRGCYLEGVAGAGDRLWRHILKFMLQTLLLLFQKMFGLSWQSLFSRKIWTSHACIHLTFVINSAFSFAHLFVGPWIIVDVERKTFCSAIIVVISMTINKQPLHKQILHVKGNDLQFNDIEWHLMTLKWHLVTLY